MITVNFEYVVEEGNLDLVLNNAKFDSSLSNERLGELVRMLATKEGGGEKTIAEESIDVPSHIRDVASLVDVIESKYGECTLLWIGDFWARLEKVDPKNINEGNYIDVVLSMNDKNREIFGHIGKYFYENEISKNMFDNMVMLDGLESLAEYILDNCPREYIAKLLRDLMSDAYDLSDILDIEDFYCEGFYKESETDSTEYTMQDVIIFKKGELK